MVILVLKLSQVSKTNIYPTQTETEQCTFLGDSAHIRYTFCRFRDHSHIRAA